MFCLPESLPGREELIFHCGYTWTAIARTALKRSDSDSDRLTKGDVRKKTVSVNGNQSRVNSVSINGNQRLPVVDRNCPKYRALLYPEMVSVANNGPGTRVFPVATASSHYRSCSSVFVSWLDVYIVYNLWDKIKHPCVFEISLANMDRF